MKSRHLFLTQLATKPLRVIAPVASLILLASCATSFPVDRSPAGCTLPTIKANQIRLLTWNLGYGGEGAGADFFADGGRRLIPSNKSTVEQYTRGIRKTIESHAADIYLLQEAARPSTVNHNVDVLGAVASSLPCYSLSYSPKVAEVFLGIHINVGQAILSHWAPLSSSRLALPGIPGSHMLKQRYFLLVNRYAIAGSTHELVIANTHLAVIDKNAKTRMAQLKTVSSFLESEYAKGNYVLVGGDWNLQFEKLHLPHSTAAKYLTWVHPFPAWFPPKGFHRGYDPHVPTVRSLDRPYSAGKNFVTTGDGFVYSPNITMTRIRVIQDGFAYSDHQPVEASFTLEGLDGGAVH